MILTILTHYEVSEYSWRVRCAVANLDSRMRFDAWEIRESSTPGMSERYCNETATCEVAVLVGVGSRIVAIVAVGF